jgi:drug/metabolite transporter (DMT)-like permease
MNRTSLIAIFSGLGAAAIWGGMYVVSKVVLNVIPPFSLLSLRLLLGILALAVIIALRPKTMISPGLAGKLFGVGVVGYGISLGFQFVGTKLSTASNGSLVTSATPAFILLFAPLLLKERASARSIAALVISTAGVIIVIDPRTAELSPALFWGNLALLAAALTWALYSVLVRRVTRNTDVVTSTAIMLAGGLPSGLLLGAWELKTQTIGLITPGIVGGVLFLGLIATAAAMFLWNYAFAQLPASTASLTFFAQPVVGTLLGAFLLGEKITPGFLLGGLLIGIGLVVASRAQ